MKKILFLALCFMATPAWATQYTVVTGYGYITNAQGHVTSYATYPIGQTVDIEGGQTYTEVANQDAMLAVPIYQAPVSPVDAFNVNTFVEQLAQTNLMTNVNIFQYYAVFKDLLTFKNFQALANMIGGLLQGGLITQSEVDTIDQTLENQQINLDSYNSEVNVAY